MYNLGAALEQVEAGVSEIGDPYLGMICRLNNIANFLAQGLDSLPPKVAKKRLNASMYILAGAKSMMEGSYDPCENPNKP